MTEVAVVANGVGPQTNGRKGKRGGAAAKAGGAAPRGRGAKKENVVQQQPDGKVEPTPPSLDLLMASAPAAPSPPQSNVNLSSLAASLVVAPSPPLAAATPPDASKKAKPLPCGVCGKNRVANKFADRERGRAEAGNKAICRPCSAFNNVLRRYGMTRDEFQKRLTAQNNKCAVCLKEFANGKMMPHIDTWSGATGTMRGIVCNSCDVSMAQFGDTIDGCLSPLVYMCLSLAEAPAAIGEKNTKLCKEVLADLRAVRAKVQTLNNTAVTAIAGNVVTKKDEESAGDDDNLDICK
jgi:hypothetical protein